MRSVACLGACLITFSTFAGASGFASQTEEWVGWGETFTPTWSTFGCDAERNLGDVCIRIPQGHRSVRVFVNGTIRGHSSLDSQCFDLVFAAGASAVAHEGIWCGSTDGSLGGVPAGADSVVVSIVPTTAPDPAPIGTATLVSW